jgi:hypothetical protein
LALGTAHTAKVVVHAVLDADLAGHVYPLDSQISSPFTEGSLKMSLTTACARRMSALMEWYSVSPTNSP